jgi:predicted RecA/RadA family phage recombinase
MQNFVQPGEKITYTNGTGSAITSGSPVVIGSLVGVAMGDIADGATGEVLLEGVVELTKTTPLAIAQGDEVFWSTSTNKVTKTATDKPLGTAHAAAGSSDTSAQVKLYGRGNGIPVAAFVAYTAGTNLTGVDGVGSNAAPLAGTETRLDAIDTAIAALKTSLINAGLMASS